MIEILPGVYYDPSLTWYKQDPQLIELADVVMQDDPIDSEMEIGAGNERMIWGEWETTTSEGTFKMRVDMDYIYTIEHGAFLSKLEHDSVVVTQLA